MSSNVIDTVVVVCLVPRAGVGVSLDKGAEWEIPVAKAARLIAHGQVRLLDKTDVKRLPTYVRPAKPADVAPAGP